MFFCIIRHSDVWLRNCCCIDVNILFKIGTIFCLYRICATAFGSQFWRQKFDSVHPLTWNVIVTACDFGFYVKSVYILCGYICPIDLLTTFKRRKRHAALIQQITAAIIIRRCICTCCNRICGGINRSIACACNLTICRIRITNANSGFICGLIWIADDSAYIIFSVDCALVETIQNDRNICCRTAVCIQIPYDTADSSVWCCGNIAVVITISENQRWNCWRSSCCLDSSADTANVSRTWYICGVFAPCRAYIIACSVGCPDDTANAIGIVCGHSAGVCAVLKIQLLIVPQKSDNTAKAFDVLCDFLAYSCFVCTTA